MRVALLCLSWRALIPAGLAAVTAVCSTAPTDVPPEPQRILFIGNSLTAANDLPGMFRALAAAGHHPTPIVSGVVRPNYSQEDHWNEGAVLYGQSPRGLPGHLVLAGGATVDVDSSLAVLLWQAAQEVAGSR